MFRQRCFVASTGNAYHRHDIIVVIRMFDDHIVTIHARAAFAAAQRNECATLPVPMLIAAFFANALGYL